MAAHNYDGDMLTDEISQVHRSPGFINSSLIGKREDGAKIMEFEASHGTVADMWCGDLRHLISPNDRFLMFVSSMPPPTRPVLCLSYHVFPSGIGYPMLIGACNPIVGYD